MPDKAVDIIYHNTINDVEDVYWKRILLKKTLNCMIDQQCSHLILSDCHRTWFLKTNDYTSIEISDGVSISQTHEQGGTMMK